MSIDMAMHFARLELDVGWGLKGSKCLPGRVHPCANQATRARFHVLDANKWWERPDRGLTEALTV